MDGPSYRCDSGVMVNIEKVATVDDVAIVIDDTIWDVVLAIVK